MKPLTTTTIIASGIAIGLAISSSLAEPTKRRNQAIKYSPRWQKRTVSNADGFTEMFAVCPPGTQIIITFKTRAGWQRQS